MKTGKKIKIENGRGFKRRVCKGERRSEISRVVEPLSSAVEIQSAATECAPESKTGLPRTITNLYNEGDVVFIKVDNEAVAKRFLRQAQREGFLINGKSKAKKSFLKDTVYMLEKGYRVHSISGFCTHMFYYSGVERSDGKKIVRISFADYINGSQEYIIKGRIKPARKEP